MADNPNLTWKELIEDDPLEGDHWKTWSDENSTDEDELSDLDDFELDENKSNQKKQVRITRFIYMLLLILSC